METIQAYLNNVFRSLPNTKEMQRLKQDIFADMELKYNELRQGGKSAHEATGMVISEFGDINELIDSFVSDEPTDNSQQAATAHYPIVTMDEANDYCAASRKSGTLIALGVGLILVGVSMMIGLYGVLESPLFVGEVWEILPVTLFLLLLIPAIGLFFRAGAIMSPYRHIDAYAFVLDFHTSESLKKDFDSLHKRGFQSAFTGVALIMLGVAIVVFSSVLGDNMAIFGVSILLILVAIAVFGFIQNGSVQESYEKLLFSEEERAIQRSRLQKRASVSAVLWPLTTCLFLIWGFLGNGWHIAWIVFPIAALLNSAFAKTNGK